MNMLERTSRTFLLPISRLPDGLQEAVGSAYLCMRAIDEIEDHDTLPVEIKSGLLTRIAEILVDGNGALDTAGLDRAMEGQREQLAAVTLGLGRFASLAPPTAARKIRAATAAMAKSMARWVDAHWRIHGKDDLDAYTFDVAGRVGLLLNELWEWFDNTKAKRDHAVGFGRALQAVNILRNRDDDARRGVNFYPPGWDVPEMMDYIHAQFEHANAYMEELPDGPAYAFCVIPLRLAEATVEAIAAGKEKLSRGDVMRVLAACG